MPDAYENIDVAVRNMLTISIAGDEDHYFPFNDLLPMGSSGVLSPYSSSSQGSQGNMSVTSPISASSSPMDITDDYINLNNAAVTILGEPCINILVQPMEKFRFRYKSEMVGTHGSLLGALNGRRRNKNNVPTVQLQNFMDNAVIRCTLVTTDDEHRIRHAHRLVRRVGTADIDDPHHIDVSRNNDFIAEFNSMGIIHTARKNIKDEIVRKLREDTLEERRHTNVNATLSIRDDAQIKIDAEHYQKAINLNSVTLCFQGFIKDENDIMRPITAPVYSNPINNLKSALTGELKICRIDKSTGSCEGGDEVFILVEKVSKKNIKIKFFELNDDDIEIWNNYGQFSELDVHHQYAMVFKTPPYKDLNITSPKDVFIQLERPSDSDCSEPIKFIYKPSDRVIGRKRLRISDSNSTELKQMAFDHNAPLTNILPTDICLSNESTDISKEINKMLDDGCPSEEFRKFVEEINLGAYENLLYKEENKLTYDGAPSKKDDKSFAKDIMNEIMNYSKSKPDKAKDVMINLLKERATYGDSPLHCALRYGQKDNVKYILMLMRTLNKNAKELVNIQNSSGKTPLHYAVSQDNSEVVKALLLLGADPNIADHYGQMPLHRAVKYSEARKNIDVLLAEKRISIETNTDLGWTPLQLAAKAGSYPAVRSLVKAGADVNNTDMSYGRTALHIAVEGGHEDVVEFLLKETSIDVNKRNFSGNTALHTAVVTPGVKAKKMCTLLIKHGADPHIRNYDRESSNIEKEEQEELVIKTETHSEDENAEDCAGQSSFDLASNKPDILRLVNNQNDESLKKVIKCKDEDIDDMQKVWMDADQEKQLAAILDETKGWRKLAQHFNFEYLMSTFEKSLTSSTLLLLNYIAIQTDISLSELQIILQGIDEEDAALYIGQILSANGT